MTERAIRAAGRRAAHAALRRGGSRVARIDRRAGGHRLLLPALLRAIPRRFDADAARGLEAVIELRIRDPAGGEPARFALQISDRRCQARRGAVERPGATVTIGAEDVIRLLSGEVGWPGLLSSGRLELAGDPFLALRFPNLFRLPYAPVVQG